MSSFRNWPKSRFPIAFAAIAQAGTGFLSIGDPKGTCAHSPWAGESTRLRLHFYLAKWHGGMIWQVAYHKEEGLVEAVGRQRRVIPE